MRISYQNKQTSKIADFGNFDQKNQVTVCNEPGIEQKMFHQDECDLLKNIFLQFKTCNS